MTANPLTPQPTPQTLNIHWFIIRRTPRCQPDSGDSRGQVRCQCVGSKDLPIGRVDNLMNWVGLSDLSTSLFWSSPMMKRLLRPGSPQGLFNAGLTKSLDGSAEELVNSAAPRDNVVFELADVHGAKGKRKSFAVVVPSGRGQPKLPSDLAGVTLTFATRPNGGDPNKESLTTDLAPIASAISERHENEADFEMLPLYRLSCRVFPQFRCSGVRRNPSSESLLSGW